MDRLREYKSWLAANKNVLLKSCSQKVAVLVESAGKEVTEKVRMLAEETKKQILQISLAGSTSKYIGETEKNLAAIFKKAATGNTILFFDEADALFGKRSPVSNSHDRYANQEVSYLLQQLEKLNGTVIFVVTKKASIDEAFLRKLGFTIIFPKPDAQKHFTL